MISEATNSKQSETVIKQYLRILEGAHIPSGGQTSADAASLADGEIEEYDYAYYDELPDGASPFVNPYDKSHQQPELLAGELEVYLQIMPLGMAV